MKSGLMKENENCASDAPSWSSAKIWLAICSDMCPVHVHPGKYFVQLKVGSFRSRDRSLR